MSLMNRKTVRGALVGAALLGMAGITPAHAEGSWNSHITGWEVGHESRRWDDRNSDGVSTLVGFSDCVTTSSLGFKSASLTLYKDVFGPDESQGARSNTCNYVSWGDKAAAKYYFRLTGLTYGQHLTVTNVSALY
ncbi:hypothetical protein ACODT5_03280 [Streptomyces sp. 5.8]|uniref:hypothetical protein n=1 Tax=Streptomyces sp. 5.8 TaxID=3406571 RepID=UPI003BB4A193